MYRDLLRVSIILFLISLIVSCNSIGVKFPIADVIYYNANVISMTGPDIVHDAIAIKDGKILAVGKWLDVVEYEGEINKAIDLKGNTIVPGFIDGHSHIMGAMENVGRANLWSPPAGGIENFTGIIEALKVVQKEKSIKKGGWVLGYGYDPDLLEEQRHPTRYDLDGAFPDNPVFINHVSGHLGVVNSAALKIMGVSRETLNPEGGEYERVAGSQIPNGIIKESASMLVTQNIPSLEEKDIVRQFMQMQAYYASCGITTAQDGFTTADQVSTLQQLNDKDSLYMDVVSLVGFLEMDSIFQDLSNVFG
ncbi:MAG: putative amidohydrolase YtcJ, partial [Saprospiraceae bacterium]